MMMRLHEREGEEREKSRRENMGSREASGGKRSKNMKARHSNDDDYDGRRR